MPQVSNKLDALCTNYKELSNNKILKKKPEIYIYFFHPPHLPWNEFRKKKCTS